MQTNLKVTANQKERTFTIRVQDNGKRAAKYRTMKYSKAEFEEKEYNTQNDWRSHLRTVNDYSVLKH